MESTKNLSHIVTELFLRGRKLVASFVFISKSYIKVPKTIRLNATHYFIMKIPNKRELQRMTSNYSSDIDFKNFMKLSITLFKLCFMNIPLKNHAHF